MKDKRFRLRWLAYLRALFGRYFWLPCPVCEKNFGGFETADQGLLTDYGGGMSVCKNCDSDAKNKNKENNYFIPTPS